MQSTARPLNLPPRMVVIAPLVMLTAIFLLVTITAAINGTIDISLIVIGTALYAATFALLYRMWVATIVRLEQLGLTDTLCHLPNRRALHSEAGSHLAAGEEVALALLDLDGFKMVNDLYGHAVGDRLIQKAALLIDEYAGEEAKAFRLGGDEFAITMNGPLCGTIAEGICRNLIERLEAPITIDERKVPIGVSIGLSSAKGTDGVTSSELLRRADIAMYASKRNGRMRYTWFKQEFDQSIEAIRDIDEELRAALANQNLQVFYQPLVDARSEQIVGVESLLRWDRKDEEAIGPDVFIPIAEESGLINIIDLFVIRQACSDALGWDTIKLSINISAAQLRNPEFPINLGEILDETGFPPERLELEITETCLVLDPILAERNLAMIRCFGVGVVLDDFGTGYASIGLLRRFRFEKLKLDRSLVVESAGDASSRAIMLSSISMAQALKMRVTAEGVETEDQATLVRTAGCDQIQGWLYYKAMPAARIEDLLNITKSQPDDRQTGINREASQ